MKLDWRTFFLKSLPYLMSIAGGVILYTGAIDNAPNDNLRDLIINVSASLLSIPLVFLLYDYTNNRINSQMKRHLVDSVSNKINDLILNMVLLMREFLGVRGRISTDGINRMLMLRASQISSKLKITPSMMNKIIAYHNDLDTILYNNSQTGIFTSEQIDILSSLARAMTHFINENKFHKNHRVSAKHLETMMTKLLDWLDMDSLTALHLGQYISSVSNKAGK